MAMEELESEYSTISISKSQAEPAPSAKKSSDSPKKVSKYFLNDLTRIRTNIGKKLSAIATKLSHSLTSVAMKSISKLLSMDSQVFLLILAVL